MSLFLPPPDYPRIRLVSSFEELVAAQFADGVNALCWPRELAGDFAEVMASLMAAGREEGMRSAEGSAAAEPEEENPGLISLDEARLRRLPVSAAGRLAIEAMIADLHRLQVRGLDPVLNWIDAYPYDDADAVVRTHVYSFHADRAPVEADTWLCTYYGATSEGLRNDQAVRRIDEPAVRAALLGEYGGRDDDGFREYLRENCYDLHYAPRPQAEPFAFGLAHLWRIALEYPGAPVPPCIHRAPECGPADPPRLLLIS